jgi:hypothetical protein
MADSNAQGTRDLLETAAAHLTEADALLCQVVASIEAAAGPGLEDVIGEPWHQLIHRLGKVRDEVGSHI